MSVKLLTEHHLECLSLKRGRTGSSESTLVKMPHCWKSHVVAHFSFASCLCRASIGAPSLAVSVDPNSIVCLFDLNLYVPSTIFQLYRDGSSWFEPVLC